MDEVSVYVPVPMFGRVIGLWHRWFAWFPVRTYDRRLAWIRFVWRAGVEKHEHLFGGPDHWFIYSIERPSHA